ncbi:MAG TPA: hypothetical protein VIH05_11055 [Tepidiformaceae bacterium]
MGVAAQSLPEKARELFSEDRLPEGFGWVAWLSPRNMRLFAVELNAALANPDQLALQALLDSWIATAELDHATEVQEAMERNRRGSFKAVDPEWLKKRLSTQ